MEQTVILPLCSTTVVRCGSTKRSNTVPSTVMLAVGVLTLYALGVESPLIQRTAPAPTPTISARTD